MEKSEMMKQFEEETGTVDRQVCQRGGGSMKVKPCPFCGRVPKVTHEFNDDEEKADAYDRLMSGRATPKELANILQAYVACNDNGRWSYFWTRPHAGKNEWYVGDYQGVLRGIALLDLPPCSCHWTDSLIVPDGWEN